MKKFLLTSFIFSIFCSYGYANDRCPEKVLDTYTIEGKYVGFECGDMCYATIMLDNEEEFTFLCGEDEATKYLQSSGNRVRVTINVEQFWNIYGNECSRYDVFHSAEVMPVASDATGFDYDQCMDNSEGVTLEILNCMQASISNLEKKIDSNLEKNYSQCDNDSCKESLKKAHQAWELYVKQMSDFIFVKNDETSSAARVFALSFLREEMVKFSELIAPQEF
ncbi:MAG: hypothetical protein EOL98_07960 [Negativicutes bacterium]|nr:hypothetical protein [Negativicutes bacterium]